MNNEFKSIKIGNQFWMSENLNVEEFQNGDIIPHVKSVKNWRKARIKEKPAWCYYENDLENGRKFGRLYNWFAVNDPRGLAPKGWHIPTDSEWTILTAYLGGEFIAGGKLKEAGPETWKSPNIGATNESGFSALPGGYRDHAGYFGGDGGWWSATETPSSDYAWFRILYNEESKVTRLAFEKNYGYSVRCLKDQNNARKNNTTNDLKEKLFQAVENCDFDQVDNLIKAGAKVNSKKTIKYSSEEGLQKYKIPLLYYAIPDLYGENESSIKIVQLLLNSGAKINERTGRVDEKWTPLFRAACNHCEKIVQLLLDHGANANLKDNNNLSVFEFMKSQYEEHKTDNFEVFKILVESTTEGNKWLLTEEGKGWSYLHTPDITGPIESTPAEVEDKLEFELNTVYGGQPKHIFEWVKSGGDIEWRTPAGRTLLHIASMYKNIEMIKFLVKFGADINAQDKEENTPLIFVCHKFYNEYGIDPKVVKVLLKLGADPNIRNEDGLSAYDYIARRRFARATAFKILRIKQMLKSKMR